MPVYTVDRGGFKGRRGGRRFWRIAIVTRVPSRDSEIRKAIVRVAKTNTILKRPINKLFAVENTYHDTK